MEQATASSATLMDWATHYVRQADDAREKMLLGDTVLPLIAAHGAPDNNDDRHADVNELEPYFVSQTRPQPEELSAFPENPDYIQLFFDVPLPQTAKELKQQEHRPLGNNQPVVADIAVEIKADAPNTYTLSAWNGLYQGKDKHEDAAKGSLSMVEIGTFEIQNPEHPLAEIADHVAQHDIMKGSFAFINKRHEHATPEPSVTFAQAQTRIHEILGIHQENNEDRSR